MGVRFCDMAGPAGQLRACGLAEGQAVPVHTAMSKHRDFTGRA